MKNKNSWDLKPKESLFSKQERIKSRDEYLKKHPEEKESFLCHCGKRHKWSEQGRPH